ncbi:hypothetical protein H9P43_007711 [Blastocladiella emersonii ATCC 22665]|nr:hypothetical protein H9P43_007711 [Blastocladiella emersonii ATCC 22665]
MNVPLLKDYVKYRGAANLKVPNYALIEASKEGHLDFLEFWFSSGLHVPHHPDNLCTLHVGALELWRNSGAELKYKELPVDEAAEAGSVDVLEWWRTSGLDFNELLEAILIIAVRDARDVQHLLPILRVAPGLELLRRAAFNLSIWPSFDAIAKSMDLPLLKLFLKYRGKERLFFTDFALIPASHAGRIDVLSWWMEAGFRVPIRVQYSHSLHVAVLDFWRSSGIKFKCDNRRSRHAVRH